MRFRFTGVECHLQCGQPQEFNIIRVLFVSWPVTQGQAVPLFRCRFISTGCHFELKVVYSIREHHFGSCTIAHLIHCMRMHAVTLSNLYRLNGDDWFFCLFLPRILSTHLIELFPYFDSYEVLDWLCCLSNMDSIYQ